MGVLIASSFAFSRLKHGYERSVYTKKSCIIQTTNLVNYIYENPKVT